MAKEKNGHPSDTRNIMSLNAYRQQYFFAVIIPSRCYDAVITAAVFFLRNTAPSALCKEAVQKSKQKQKQKKIRVYQSPVFLDLLDSRRRLSASLAALASSISRIARRRRLKSLLGLTSSRPIDITALETADNHLRRGNICSDGYIVNVAQTKQVECYLVGRGLDRRITEKDNDIHLIV